MKNFGTIRSRLSDLLRDNKHTISEISEETNISRNSIYRLINDTSSSFNIEVLSKICHYLKIGINDLLYYEESEIKFKYSTVKVGDSLYEASDMVRKLRSLHRNAKMLEFAVNLSLPEVSNGKKTPNIIFSGFSFSDWIADDKHKEVLPHIFLYYGYYINYDIGETEDYDNYLDAIFANKSNLTAVLSHLLIPIVTHDNKPDAETLDSTDTTAPFVIDFANANFEKSPNSVRVFANLDFKKNKVIFK
ncbi:MAG: helix-turn-helix transcriptional regulator [Lentilactobacillus diolivorans]|uniref:helix-turn-helix domain-containing protein n=1 Tax=Lentilactobacillus diolivorans TaxID=179838 RepID=UPI0039EBA353